MSVWLVGLAVVIVVGIAIGIYRASRRGGQTTLLEPASDSHPVRGQLVVEASTAASDLPAAIVICDHPDRPAVRISALTDSERFRVARSVEMSGDMLGRVSAVLQAAPTLLIESAHRGKQLMEVVINGDLIRAADGNGFRAMAVNANGKVAEHARLFSADKLQEVVNVAAVWQIASVVVAQKHLADISAKLDLIVKGLKQVYDFLDTARRARISSTHRYLGQVAEAVQAGEMAPAARIQLEACERDMLEVHNHLLDDLRKLFQQEIKHTKSGTQTLTQDLVQRYQSLENLVVDVDLCLRTRVLAWHILSLVPGEPQIKLSRQRDILRSVEELAKLQQLVDLVVAKDVDRVKSIFNWTSTLDERKQKIRDAATSSRTAIESTVDRSRENIEKSSSLLLTHDEPTILFAEIEDGRVVSVREPALMAV